MTLRVTLEIVPFGDEEKKRTIHIIDICNEGSKTDLGRTRYRAVAKPEPFRLANNLPIFKLAHYREDGAIKLARKALQRAERLFPHMG